MKNSKLVVAAFAALSLTASQAIAEGEEEGDPCGGGEEGMGGDPCGGGEAMPPPDDGAGDAAATGGEGLAGYPQAQIDRPGVLPKGMLEITGSVPISYIKILDTSATSVGLGIGARYGLAPKIDAQLTYGFSLKDFEIKGDLGVVAQYDIKTSEKLRVAARVSTGYSVVGEAFDGVGLGLNLQYKLTPKIAVFTNGDHLSLGGADFPKPVAINLPVGFGMQVNEKIFAHLETSIGTIGLSPSGNTLISDATPIILGAEFSPSNKMDVGASIGFPDVQHAGDFLIFDVHAALRM